MTDFARQELQEHMARMRALRSQRGKVERSRGGAGGSHKRRNTRAAPTWIRPVALNNPPNGTLPLRGAILPPSQLDGTARVVHAGTSEWWAQLDWSWIGNAARRVRRVAGGEWDDIRSEIALETVIQLSGGLDLRAAINRAEVIVTQRVRRDRVCGMTGDNRVLRRLTRGLVPVVWCKPIPGGKPQLMPGDWRALHNWLARVLPDRGEKAVRAREVLAAVLRGESLASVADRLGITLKRAAAWRTEGIARCRKALQAAA